MPDKRYTALGLGDFKPEQISPAGRKSLPDYNDNGYGGVSERMGFGPYGPQLSRKNHRPRLQIRPLKFLPHNQDAGRTPLLGKGGMQTQTGRVKSSTTPMTFPSPHMPDSTLAGSDGLHANVLNANINGLLTVGGTRKRPKYDNQTYPYEGKREAQLMRNALTPAMNELRSMPEEGNPPVVDPYSRSKREQVGGINQYEKRRAYMTLRPDEYPEVAQTRLAPVNNYVDPFRDAVARYDKVDGANRNTEPQEDTAKLVADLASPMYGIRQLASQKLEKQGKGAIEELSKVADPSNRDVEQRLSAMRILNGLASGIGSGELEMNKARSSGFFGVDESSGSPREMDAMRRQFMESQYQIRKDYYQ
jgi:hypothetical protein